MQNILYLIIVFGIIVSPYILYLFFKSRKEKKYLEFTQEMDRESNEISRLLEKVSATHELEQDLKSKCLDESCAEEVYKELHDDLVSVFGEDYRSKFVIPMHTKEWYMESNHACWAWRLLLARRGHIDKMTYFTGISIGGEKNYDWQIKFCKLIEKYLMDSHPEEGINVQMAVKPKPDISYSPVKNEVRNVMNPYGRYGINITLWKFVLPEYRRRPWSDGKLPGVNSIEGE